MKILHTSDWHIGQQFHSYDRSEEHLFFFDQLLNTIGNNGIDILVIAGDIFDVSNPSAAAQSLYYNFLLRLHTLYPSLKVVMIAGNHDSASRLEAPKEILDALGISIVGKVHRKEDGTVDYSKHIVTLNHKEMCVHFVCVPYLRQGDYPKGFGSYENGVKAFYRQALDYAKSKGQEDDCYFGIGHLYAANVTLDKEPSELLSIGGTDCINLTDVEGFSYLALGHIHRAQKIGGNAMIQYSGSPLPMSFTEEKYQHGMVEIDITKEHLLAHSIELIPKRRLLSVPSKYALLPEVLEALEELPNGSVNSDSPYVEVRVLLNQIEPNLRQQVEDVLTKKSVLLATIRTEYAQRTDQLYDEVLPELNELEPKQIFEKYYQSVVNEDTDTPQYKKYLSMIDSVLR